MDIAILCTMCVFVLWFLSFVCGLMSFSDVGSRVSIKRATAWLFLSGGLSFLAVFGSIKTFQLLIWVFFNWI